MPETPSTIGPGAIFLSYAKQDTAPAKRICDALRASGLEVWFDQSELRGGDAWDQQIRKQIKECALFVPIISAHTQTRAEGYFRLEWHLAEQRTYLMAHDQHFLMPVVVDDTADAEARVPERFRERQWTRLQGGAASPEFCDRVRRLVGATPAASRREGAPAPASGVSGAPARSPGPLRWIVAAGVVAAAAVAFLYLTPRHNADNVAPAEPRAATVPVPAKTQEPAVTAAPASTSDKSVAVLAFTNLSDDKDNEYFSDGISEELLTVLQKIPGLRVAARTSAFSFKGTNATAQEIGAKLGVADLVDGSVQKSGNRVRITARLSRAATGDELWSQTYTRELKDVFALQDELALAIVGELRGRLPGGGDQDATVVRDAARGGTTNTEAYQEFLKGRFFETQFTEANAAKALGFLQHATELDPSYALAWAELAHAHIWYCDWAGQMSREQFDAHLGSARSAVDKALSLDPDLPEGLAARFDLQLNFDFDAKAAAETGRRALAVAPDDPNVISGVCWIDMIYGKTDSSIELGRKAVALDPVNPRSHLTLAISLLFSGRYSEAREEFGRLNELNPALTYSHAGVGLAYVFEGKYAEAVAATQGETTIWSRLFVLSIAYTGLKQTADADATLSQLIQACADTAAYQIAEVYAFRGDGDHAFEWLERAKRQHDPGVIQVSTDPVFKNIQADPRWTVFIHSLGLAADQLQ